MAHQLILRLSPMSDKMQHCFIIRLSCDIMLYYHTLKSVIDSLKRPENIRNPFNQRIILRGNCNTQYLRREKYFHCAGFIARGSFGIVELVSLKSEGKFYALKSIEIPKVRSIAQLINQAFIERDAWLTLSGEHVVKLKAAWIESNRPDCADIFCMLCEFMSRGTLNDVIEQFHPLVTSDTDFSWKPGYMNLIKAKELQTIAPDIIINKVAAEVRLIKENQVRLARFKNIYLMYIKSIINAVHYLHDHKIIHRDIKLENILVTVDLQLKLADLGLAAPFRKEHNESMFSWSKTYEGSLKTNYTNKPEMTHYYAMEKEFKSKFKAFQRGINVPGGPRNQPPEFHEKYYEQEGHENDTFALHRHYAGDWYAVGCVIHHLVTGIHPIDHVKIFSEFKDRKIRKSLIFLAKFDPTKYNRILYGDGMAGRDLVRSLYIDTRFLIMMRAFLKPNPTERPDGRGVLKMAIIDRLYKECCTGESPGWKWNEFRRQHKVLRSQCLVQTFLNGYRAPFGRLTRLGKHNIPDLPLFPMMTGSPAIVPSP